MNVADIILAVIGGGGVGGMLRFITKVSSALAVLTEGVTALKDLLNDHENRMRVLEQKPAQVDLTPPEKTS